MRPDIFELRAFYASSLGQIARRYVRRQIRTIWPDVKGLSVLGLGYATPFLRPFHSEAERVVAFMPAQQGVIHWPADGKRLTALTDEFDLPLPDQSIDRLLLVHSLEHAWPPNALLREIWRVLASDGRLLIVVPNRRGIWSRVDSTPFGHGLPYSRGQLNRLLRDGMFQPLQRGTAMYFPPYRREFMLKTAGAWERLGGRFVGRFSGVLLVEADKQIYAVTARPAQRSGRRLRAVATSPQAARTTPFR